jgi:hypothetical protein
MAGTSGSTEGTIGTTARRPNDAPDRENQDPRMLHLRRAAAVQEEMVVKAKGRLKELFRDINWDDAMAFAADHGCTALQINADYPTPIGFQSQCVFYLAQIDASWDDE